MRMASEHTVDINMKFDLHRMVLYQTVSKQPRQVEGWEEYVDICKQCMWLQILWPNASCG